MSRRSQRKRGLPPDSDSTGGSKAKEAKVLPDVVWEWEGDGGKWNQYAPGHCQSLTSALIKGETDVTLQVAPSVKMRVRLDAMTQMNVSTGWQRNVRCLPPSGSSSTGVWEFHDVSRDHWTAYSTSTQRHLEACLHCGSENTRVETTSGQWFKVDLKARKQVSEESGESSKVRRSDATVWQWEDEHGHWLDYPLSICLQIEAAHSEGKPSVIGFNAEGRSYQIDLSCMEQENSATSVKRKVRRSTAATSGATPSTSSAGAIDAASAVSKKTGTTSKKTGTTSKKAGTTSSECVRGSNSADGHVTLVIRGKVPVDYACTQKVGKAHVFSEGGEYWDAMLNQTNLKNNNNKFYICQLLEDNISRSYSTWFRWGRVGKTGQNSLFECGTDLDLAKQYFTKNHSKRDSSSVRSCEVQPFSLTDCEIMFYDKTVNHWEDRQNFVKHAGKYDMLLMDYEAKDEPDVGDEEEEEKTPDSKLDKRVQSLIELICNVRTMEDMVMEMKYDIKKAPLGKLTADQIRSGYTAVKKIEDCITRNHFGDQLVQACDEFYTRIPHNFGYVHPFLSKGRARTCGEKRRIMPGLLMPDLPNPTQYCCNILLCALWCQDVPILTLNSWKGFTSKQTCPVTRFGTENLETDFPSVSHGCYGFLYRMQRPPIIRTREEVKEKLALLEALGDIRIALKVLRGGGEGQEEHPIDRHYHSLNCDLSPIDHKDGLFKLLVKYVHQTHAKTHTQYKLEVMDIYDITRHGERERFRDVGNRQLLWHGSRLTNWVGILSQGLRIAPPEAPVTGYMFGKGVYFADMCSKSANYCFASKANSEGLVLLCEVALGQPNDLLAADHTADKLPKDKHSTRGLGRVAPNPTQNETLPDGCVVPLGTSVDTAVHNPHGYTLNYNEYIVYDTRQIKMRYLVRVKFLFK